MRWIASVLLALALGCPDTGGLVVVDEDAGRDGGSGVDGGFDAAVPADGGGDSGEDASLAGCDPLLRCTRSCDGLFDSVLLDPSFETMPASLSVLSGTVRAEGGALVFERDSMEPRSSVSTVSQFSDALLCARIRMPGGGEGISVNLFAVGWLTGSGGVELFLEGREEQITFHSLEVLPDGVLLGRRDHTWAAEHEMIVLTYFSERDGLAYAEFFDTTMDVAFALRGSYGGEPPPALGYLSALEPKLLEPVRVLDLQIGVPSSDVLAVIER